jgi:RNA polymerase sigma-70 factor, ECF subfamily
LAVWDTLLRVDPAERDLIVRAQDRDADAFSTLVGQRWPSLVRFARSVAARSDAEDIVQESLLRAWQKLPRLRAPEAFPTWLLRIVSRACFRHTRKMRFLLPLDAAAGKADPDGGSPLSEIHVESILAALAPRQRAVMHLTAIEGMTDSEIGAALAISAAAVRSHRRRAREAMGRILPQTKTGEAIHE